ncbi:type II toxin-antitoxin system HicB family antitoxin [Vaginisenegalia massiliensis]|uniref:type II toxin-antitoxin system HicB family antitoxin n=1 Tax=Vaginisenegalia massiliensis TaxID=2058294 RepID=UPI001F151C5F|nr:type II toxin-antitoxin system HicB family antitoxin [Vaginisenegalia massiliensis]
MKNNKVFYPAIFTNDGDAYNVQFIDVPEAITFGETLDEAFKYAQDALGLALFDKEEIPEPRTLNSDIKLSEGKQIVLVNLDLQEYRSKMNHKTVKKNTTIQNI